MSPVRRGEKLPIYNRIAVLRAEHRLSRASLAERIEVNPQTVGALERGDHYPSLDLAFRICAVFEDIVARCFNSGLDVGNASDQYCARISRVATSDTRPVGSPTRRDTAR